MRTCVGCLAKMPSRELIRLGEGRGAYLCSNLECFEKAMKKKAFSRALRRPVSPEEINDFRQGFEEQLKVDHPAAGRHGDGPR